MTQVKMIEKIKKRKILVVIAVFMISTSNSKYNDIKKIERGVRNEK